MVAHGFIGPQDVYILIHSLLKMFTKFYSSVEVIPQMLMKKSLSPGLES